MLYLLSRTENDADIVFSPSDLSTNLERHCGRHKTTNTKSDERRHSLSSYNPACTNAHSRSDKFTECHTRYHSPNATRREERYNKGFKAQVTRSALGFCFSFLFDGKTTRRFFSTSLFSRQRFQHISQHLTRLCSYHLSCSFALGIEEEGIWKVSEEDEEGSFCESPFFFAFYAPFTLAYVCGS